MTTSSALKLTSIGAVAVVVATLGLANLAAMRQIDISPLTSGRSAIQPMSASEPVKRPDPLTTTSDDIITSQPLFSPNRRPYIPQPPPVEQPLQIAPQEPEPPPVVIEPPKIRFLGIRRLGGAYSALVGLDQKPADWVQVGADVNGWRIEAIDANSLQIRLAGRHATYDLYQVHSR